MPVREMLRVDSAEDGDQAVIVHEAGRDEAWLQSDVVVEVRQ